MKTLKHILAAALALGALQANALILKPGLWSIDMTLTHNGKEIEPMKELQQAMKEMPEDRRKQMMQAMEESGVNIGGKKMKQCYTKEMIEKADLGVHEDKNCRTETVKKTDKVIVSNFTCKDGSKGTATINIKNKKSYSGHMVMTNAQGEESKLDYNANYMDKDCGSVKPVGV